MFIGDKEVDRFEVLDFKTLLDNDVYLVHYKDGSEEMLTKKMYDVVIGENKVDLTALRDLRMKAMVQDLLIIMQEWNPMIDELEYAHILLNTSLQDSANRATEALYGVPKNRTTLLHVDRVLKTHAHPDDDKILGKFEPEPEPRPEDE